MVFRHADRKITMGPSGKEGVPPFEKKELVPIELLQGAGRFLSTIVFPPNGQGPIHDHINEYEVYLMLSGVGNYNDNGTIVQVYPGDTMYCPDGEFHNIVNASDTEDLVLLGLVAYANPQRAGEL